MTLILRTVKGSKLTWNEVDGNFAYLEDKIENVEALVDGADVVKVTPQVFLPAQQDQARSNVGAASFEELEDLTARVDFLETIEPVTYDLQSPTPQQQEQLRANADVFSKQEINDMLAPVTGLSFGLFEHLLTAGDLANPVMVFNLPNVPSDKHMDFLFIGSAPVSPASYTVTGNNLQIDQAAIDYELQANRRLIFRYMY